MTRPYALFGRNWISKGTRMVEIATNPQGYRVHASAVLMRYATDKNQPPPTQYHISGHNFNLDIAHSHGSVIGNAAA